MTRKAPKQQRDADGRRLCRRCGAVVTGRRRSYCSQICADDFAVAHFPQFARNALLKRDRGVCSQCGCDTEKLRRVLEWAWRFGCGRDLKAIARDLGFKGWIHRGDFWQADHVTPVALGGWGKGIDNFRTLCTPCHKELTARLVRELAEGRRAAKEGAPLFSEMRSA
jgi:5-methylcytosine-specific restriction enzyme A